MTVASDLILQQQGGGAGNMLSGLPWLADANTSLSVVGSNARATSNNSAAGNPRIWKAVPVVIGATYRVVSTTFIGTATGGSVRFRVSTSSAIPDGNIYELISSGTSNAVDTTFTPSVSTVYIGIVGLVSTNGEYSEILDNTTLVRIA